MDKGTWWAAVHGVAKELDMTWQLNNNDNMDCSPPSSLVHGIFQSRTLEWVAISPPGDLPDTGIKSLSLLSPALVGGCLTTQSPGKPLRIVHGVAK